MTQYPDLQFESCQCEHSIHDDGLGERPQVRWMGQTDTGGPPAPDGVRMAVDVEHVYGAVVPVRNRYDAFLLANAHTVYGVFRLCRHCVQAQHMGPTPRY